MSDSQPSGEALPSSFAGGRYLVRRVLGRGGQKVVYLVYDSALDRECALALIKDELRFEEVARLRHEAQALARMGAHPHVVTVYDLGEEGGRPFVVCEYVAGGDLADELARAGGPLPVERAASIAGDLLRALQAVHEQGVVHRDLKPRNVWLAGGGAAKLGDFGLALAPDQSRLTLEGAVTGTPAYAAPEQLQGHEVDGRADLYALGCVLYEMATGRPPFVGTMVAMVSQHLHAAPTPPRRLNPDVAPSWEAFILRLLAKSPSERPASAREALAELDAAVTAIATSATTPALAPPTVESPPRAARGKRRLWMVSLPIVPLALGALLLWSWKRPPPPTGMRRVMVLATREPGDTVDGATAWALASRIVEEVDHYKEFRPVSPAGMLAARLASLGDPALVPDEVGATTVARRVNADTVAALAIARAGDDLTVAVHVFPVDDPAAGVSSMRERLRRADLDGDGPVRVAGKLAQTLARQWRMGPLTDELAGMASRPVSFEAYRVYTAANQYCVIGRYDQCEKLVRQALESDPQNALYLALLACALSYQGAREVESEAVASRAYDLRGQLMSLRHQRVVEQDRLWVDAERLRRKGDRAGARATGERILALDLELARTWRDPWGYLYAAATYQYFLEDIPHAREMYAETRRLAPSLYPPYHEEAKLVGGAEAARVMWTYITCFPSSEMAEVAKADARAMGLARPAGALPCPAAAE